MRGAPVFGHQRILGRVVIADDVDHPVKVQERNQKAAQHLKPVVDFLHPVGGPAQQNLAAMVQECTQHFFHRADARGQPVDQHVHVQAEPHLKIGIAKQHAHQHIGVNGAHPWFQDQPDIIGRFVADIGQQRHLFGLHNLGQPFDQPGFLHLIGDLGHHNLPGAAAQILDLPATAQPERPPPCAIGVSDIGGRFDNNPAGRKIGAGDMRQKFIIGRVGVGDQMQAGVDQLVQIMRRNIGGHADRNPGGPIGQQVGERGGQNDGFLQGAVVIVPKINGVFGQPFQQRLGGLGQPRLGIATGGWVIAVDIAKVALAIHQRIAHVEILRQPGHRIVNRHVAMRVIIAHHIAADLGRFAETAVRRQFQLAHRV